jgi:hypothetical protein
MATVSVRAVGVAALPEGAAAGESSSDEALIRRIAAGETMEPSYHLLVA